MPALWMLFASFMFAAMGAGVKLASSLFSTSEIVMYRGIIGMVILFTIIRVQGGTLKTTMPLAHLWRGVTEAGPYQSPMEDGMQHFHEWYRSKIAL